MKLYVKKYQDLTKAELYEILKVRLKVFVIEQNCPYLEIDDKDQYAYHVFVKENDQIVAYLRVIEKGISYQEVSIGRVLTITRSKGLGRVIMDAGIKVAKEKYGADKIRIEAQSYAKEFYAKFGFKQVSTEFLEDNILHIEMLLDLADC